MMCGPTFKNLTIYIFFLFWLLSVFNKSTGEILYRVELPYLEEITLIYLEDNDKEFSKS